MAPGLFGKLPAHGDFISRGLSASLRQVLDHWITQNIGQRALPTGGLRARLTLRGTPILTVIVQSHDKHGRVFPIVAVAEYTGQEGSSVDKWCDLVAKTLSNSISGVTDVDTLMQDMPPAPQGTIDDPPQTDVMWQQGQTAQSLAAALEKLSSD